MATPAQKQKRAEQARINGAKSKGAKTPEGIAKARTASFQHGLYATEATLLSTVDDRQYAELRARYQSVWAPENKYLEDKVDDLVSYRWELNRLREVRRKQMAEVYADLRAVDETEFYATQKGSVLEKLDLRIRRCNLELSRIERDLVRLTKHFKSEGASHNTNKPRANTPLFHTFSTVAGNQTNPNSEKSGIPEHSAPPPSASEPPN